MVGLGKVGVSILIVDGSESEDLVEEQDWSCLILELVFNHNDRSGRRKHGSENVLTDS